MLKYENKFPKYFFILETYFNFALLLILNIKNMKVTKETVGKYIVMPSKAFVETNGIIPWRSHIVDEHNKEIMPYGVFRVDLYNGDFNYKVILNPVGLFSKLMDDQKRYSCSIESCLFPIAEYFDSAITKPDFCMVCCDDPIQAYCLAKSLNKKHYPEFAEFISNCEELPV